MANATRLRQPSSVRGKVVTAGGGGGGGMGGWPSYGRDDGSYDRAIQGTQSTRGFYDHVVQDFKRDVGVKDLYNPGLVNSAMAGRAKTHAQTKAPKFVSNFKEYAASAKKAMDADTEIKQESVELAIHNINQVPIQNLEDHKLARAAMSAKTAIAINQWHTTEHYIQCQASIRQAARQTTGAF